MTLPNTEPVAFISKQEIGLEDFVVDLIVTETHEVTSRTTQYPVESGAQITDHAIRLPAKLVVEGVVASYEQTEFNIDFPQSGDIVNTYQRTVPIETWHRILTAIDNHEVFDVQTLMGRYQNMMIRKANANFDEKTGINLFFKIEMIELIEADQVEGIGVTNPGAAAEGRTATVSAGRIAAELSRYGYTGLGTEINGHTIEADGNERHSTGPSYSNGDQDLIDGLALVN